MDKQITVYLCSWITLHHIHKEWNTEAHTTDEAPDIVLNKGNPAHSQPLQEEYAIDFCLH